MFELTGPQGSERGGDGIEIDWEHDSYTWALPEDVRTGKYDTVPHLWRSLERVLVSSATERGLKELKEDHENGARVLAIKALEALVDAFTEEEDGEEGQSEEEAIGRWWRKARMSAWHLATNGRPSMSAAITSAIVKAMKQIGEECHLTSATKATEIDSISGPLSGSLVELKAKATSILRFHIHARTQATSTLSKNFTNYLVNAFTSTSSDKPLRILTLSNSSTISAAIIHALGNLSSLHLHLSILESRPLLEGVALAKRLISSPQASSYRSRIRVTIAADAAVGSLAATGVDLVLLGSDRIWSTGAVRNKIGSLGAAQAGKKNGATVAVISETDKISRLASSEDDISGLALTKKARASGVKPHGEEDLDAIAAEMAQKSKDEVEETNDPSELSKAWNAHVPDVQDVDGWERVVEVKNFYFETVPADLIDAYVSEEGVLSREQVKEYAGKVGEMEDALWGDL